MKYIVIESQVQDGTVANLVTAHDNPQQARAKYHAILSAAVNQTATVTVPCVPTV